MTTFDRTERRILGVLIEKALTTPDQYPLTINALVAGCNQKNNRDPLMSLEDWEVDGAVRSLLLKEWLREIHRAGGRAARYAERLRERLGLETKQAAVLAELFLRGPSTAAEVRTRGSRMTDLGSNEDVLRVLEGLAADPFGLVTRLPRHSGERGERWAHTLAPADEVPTPPTGSESEGTTTQRSTSPDVRERIDRLEQQVAALRSDMARIARKLEIELEGEKISAESGSDSPV